MTARVYVTRPIFDQGVERLKREVHVEVNSDERVLSKSELISHLREADGALTLLTDIINREVLDACPRLKVVANFAVGFNNVDIEAATERGVIVTNTPGVLTETTADFAWTLLMAAARRVVEATSVSDEVAGFVVSLVRQTRELPAVELGASPRAAVHLLAAARGLACLAGRDYVTPDDIVDVARPVLRHRLVLRPEAELERYSAADAVEAALAAVPVPR